MRALFYSAIQPYSTLLGPCDFAALRLDVFLNFMLPGIENLLEKSPFFLLYLVRRAKLAGFIIIIKLELLSFEPGNTSF